ncbi:MAG: hypothetical protein HYU29_09095 [Chloroflexi bacterium]|nr:hypothetical protein [Chloroflexota bacterium]
MSNTNDGFLFRVWREKTSGARAFRMVFRIPGRVAGFFFTAWLVMVMWGIVGPRVGLDTIGYPTAMLVTLAVWLVMAVGGLVMRRW